MSFGIALGIQTEGLLIDFTNITLYFFAQVIS